LSSASRSRVTRSLERSLITIFSGINSSAANKLASFSQVSLQTVCISKWPSSCATVNRNLSVVTFLFTKIIGTSPEIKNPSSKSVLKSDSQIIMPFASRSSHRFGIGPHFTSQCFRSLSANFTGSSPLPSIVFSLRPACSKSFFR